MNLYNKKDEVNYQFDHGSDDQSQSMILSTTDWEIFVGLLRPLQFPKRPKCRPVLKTQLWIELEHEKDPTKFESLYKSEL